MVYKCITVLMETFKANADGLVSVIHCIVRMKTTFTHIHFITIFLTTVSLSRSHSFDSVLPTDVSQLSYTAGLTTH